jgi:flagella basal body P-ring formation protein FlgA
VSGDNIVARDLAKAIPAFAEVDSMAHISFAPRPGLKRIFSNKEIHRLAERFQLEVDPAASVCFKKESAFLTVEKIRGAIADSLQVEPSSIEVNDFTRSSLPQGKIEFPLSGAGRPTATASVPFTWRGRLLADGHSYPIWASVRVSIERQTVTAAAPISKGQSITNDLISLRQVRFSPFDKGAISDPQTVVGKIARTELKIGQPIRVPDLETPREVSQGEAVRVKAVSGQAQITFEARAQTGGRSGDTILVQNPANGRSFRAKITGKGEVECDSSR